MVLVTVTLFAGCGTTTVGDGGPARERPEWDGWSRLAVPARVTLPTETPVTGRTTAHLASGPTLVNVWASYCGPCVKEMPLLERVNGSGGLQVVGISRDRSAKAARNALEQRNITYPNWLDPAGHFLVALDGALPLAALPASALMVEGKVVAVHIGPFHSTAEALRALRLAGRTT